MFKNIIFQLFPFIGIVLCCCSSAPSLQTYFVDNQEKNGFISIDVPISVLGLESIEMSSSESEALSSISKFNILSFSLDSINHTKYSEELLKGEQLSLPQAFNSYVMENILFKISFPAEFHAQTAVEAAVILHPQIKDKLDEIKSVEITTHDSAIRIISKVGELNNPADRDHCLQYMVAIGLLKGDLVAEDYEEYVASDPRVDALREKMVINEDKRYSEEYHEADKRSIANRIKIHFVDGSSTDEVEVEYPIGHKRRREEGIPVLEQKFLKNLEMSYDSEKCDEIYALCTDQKKLENTSVIEFQELLSKKENNF